AEEEGRQGGCRWQRFGYRRNRDARGAIGRKAVDAGRDRRKSHRSKVMLAAKLNRAAIAGGEQIVFVEAATVPHRPDGVDHVLRRKPISFGDLGIAGLAAVQHPAFSNEVRSRRAMDGAIDAASTEERRV